MEDIYHDAKLHNFINTHAYDNAVVSSALQNLQHDEDQFKYHKPMHKFDLDNKLQELLSQVCTNNWPKHQIMDDFWQQL